MHLLDGDYCVISLTTTITFIPKQNNKDYLTIHSMSYSVLVCDDSVVARKQVIRCLNGIIDADICQACNGREALEVLAERHIDLLCLDLTMPVLDGIGVLETIKRQVIETYVVVISADIQDEMKTRVAKLGALEFLEKPVKSESLQATLSKFGIR